MGRVMQKGGRKGLRANGTAVWPKRSIQTRDSRRKSGMRRIATTGTKERRHAGWAVVALNVRTRGGREYAFPIWVSRVDRLYIAHGANTALALRHPPLLDPF